MMNNNNDNKKVFFYYFLFLGTQLNSNFLFFTIFFQTLGSPADKRPNVVWGRGLSHVLHEIKTERNDDEMKCFSIFLFSFLCPARNASLPKLQSKLTLRLVFRKPPGAERDPLMQNASNRKVYSGL